MNKKRTQLSNQQQIFHLKKIPFLLIWNNKNTQLHLKKLNLKQIV